MKKLSKEKLNQLILIGLGTVGVMAGLWFFLVSAQMAKINDINVKITGAEKDIQKKQQTIKEAGKVEAELHESQAKLCLIENTMPSGPAYTWVNSALRKFNATGYKVDMQAPSTPIESELTTIPNFPYHQLTVGVSGNANYADLGRYVADFENHFPCMRIQNLNLEPGSGATPEDRLKLAFRMEIIILTKASNL